MAPQEENTHIQIISDLNCLARLAALDNAWETRTTAALMAELYRYRRRNEGEPVELAAELRAVEICLRLVKPRHGTDCTWDFHIQGIESVLVPRGEILHHIEESVSRHLDSDQGFHVCIEAAAEETACVILLSDSSGEKKAIHLDCAL